MRNCMFSLGWQGLRLMIEKSAATAAAFSCHLEIRRLKAA